MGSCAGQSRPCRDLSCVGRAENARRAFRRDLRPFLRAMRRLRSDLCSQPLARRHSGSPGHSDRHRSRPTDDRGENAALTADTTGLEYCGSHLFHQLTADGGLQRARDNRMNGGAHHVAKSGTFSRLPSPRFHPFKRDAPRPSVDSFILPEIKHPSCYKG